MERAIAEMEKIRKAEEIYSKRRNLEDEEKKPKNVYKFMFELLMLINIIIIIVAVQNQKYIFTQNFINQVNSYNVNIREKFESFFSQGNGNKEDNKNDDKKENADVAENEQEKDSKKDDEENEKNANSQSVSGKANEVSSGAVLVENELQEETLDLEEPQTQENIELSQEDKDVNEIKEKYSVALPINGVKTSGFGERESTNSKVTKNHTGVDIAAALGTVITSATTGKVIEVSSSGDYGKHFRVQTGDMVVLYAHCSKIYVKEGQEINQGDKIAEVGSTGNSTGPHLHFEIKLYDRLVNPERIIEIN